MNNWGKVMVIAVHPDDETLGCGGTLLRLAEMGKELASVIVTTTQNSTILSKEYTEKRRGEIELVKNKYGFAKKYQLPFEAGMLEETPKIDVVKAINEAVRDFQPDTIFLPFPWDIHKEHQVTFEAALACTKVFRNPFIKRVILMETPSETDFVPANVVQSFTPNLFVDITNQLEKKLEVMQIFDSEVLPHPFPRSLESIRALAVYRGGQAGCGAVESFMMIKEII